MPKEVDGKTRISVLLPSEQVRALKLISIYQEESLTDLTRKALDEYMISLFGEHVIEGLKKATTLIEMRELLGDYVKN